MRTDIQALRGIAVSFVVLYHAELGLVGAGYLGVDVFFVISGYLITKMICREIDAGQFSFPVFYWRRAKRLLPAAYVTFFVTSLAALTLTTAAELASYFQQLVGAVTFTANFVLAQQVNYFDSNSSLKPLLHIWSLAVEEQYYLVAPLLFCITPQKNRRWLVLGILIVSLALCVAFARSKPAFAFYMLPARAWELSIGAMIALVPPCGSSPFFRKVLGNVALLVMMILPVWSVDKIHPRLDAVIICTVTALVIQTRPILLQRGTFAFVFARIGDISYSLYLVHWPVFSFVRQVHFGDVSLPLRLTCIAISLLLAILLYRYVERPIHRAEILPSRPVIFAVAAIICLTLAIPYSYLRLSSQAADWADLRKPVYGYQAICNQSDGAFVVRRECQNAEAPLIAVWGDSFAMHLVPGIAALDLGFGVVQLTRSTCPPALPDEPAPSHYSNRSCADFNWSVFDYLRGAERIRYVILSTAYDPMKLGRTIRELRAIGKKVVFVAAPPSIGVDFSLCVERQNTGRLMFNAPSDCKFSTEQYRSRGAQLIQGARDLAASEAVGVIWPSDFLCDATSCLSSDGLFPLFRDSDHLSVYGSKFFAKKSELLDTVVSLAR